jgi:hypothetical protein
MWPCIAESPALKPLVTGGGAAGLYLRLQHIEVATPAAGVAPQAAMGDVVLDLREVSLLFRIEQSGDIVHSFVHALSAVLGEEAIINCYDEQVAGLAFDFGDSPVLVCHHHEYFPDSLSLTLCAVRSDGLVASVMPTTSLTHTSGHPFGPHFGGENQHAVNPTLEGFAPVTHTMNIADMFTATQGVPSPSVVDAFVEANEEVQDYRLQGGGPITVKQDTEIHLGNLAPGEDNSTPLSERYQLQADGSFSVLDEVRICPEGVLIDRLGMSFRLEIESEVLGTDDEGDKVPEFGAFLDLPLDATVAPLNERVVFS